MAQAAESATNDIDNTVTLPCVHCGLPSHVSSEDDPRSVFCCNGCRGAYELIHGWGLSDFYALRDQLGASETSSVSGDRRGFESFDSEPFLGMSAPIKTSDGKLMTDLALHGLHCGACAWLIENAAARTPGWLLARVRMSDHTIRIVFDPELIRLSEIARLLDQLGYEIAPLTKHADDQFRRENRKLLVQIAVAGFCATNAMWIAIGLYAGEASGVAAGHWGFLRLMGTGLGLASVVGPGRTFFRGAFASLRTRTPHMDLPIALGLTVGTVVGAINAVAGAGAVYFDSLAVLVFLLLIGRWIQFRQQHRAAKAVDLLLRITPRHAKRVTSDGEEETVLVDALSAGDTVRVAAGDNIPVDGEVIEGETTIDRSLLTGESHPIPAHRGSEVLSGTVNLSRPIDVRVMATGAECRIGKVMRSVEEAASAKAPIVQLADRIGGVFVITVTAIAIATFVGWLGQGWNVAAENATALLIVACPCALALATPLAIAVALGRSARRKILVRDGASLQHLAGRGMIWFDKTGTLTEGRPRVVEVFGDVRAIARAAAIESKCCHPVADGIIREAHRRSLPIPEEADLQGVGKGGIFGNSDGRMVDVGNLAFMIDRDIWVDERVRDAAAKFAESGSSPILIAIDKIVVVVLAIADPVRAEAGQTVSRIIDAGWGVGILSGDHQSIVHQVAEQIGVPVDRAYGDLSPEDKLRMICDRTGQREKTVMIGDGANDAAALAAADVGIAVRGGAEVSLQAAPIYVASGNLRAIFDLLCGARSTQRLIFATFAVSLAYNLVAVVLAASGQISPLVAAVLMPISSVSVLAITMAWPTFKAQDS